MLDMMVLIGIIAAVVVFDFIVGYVFTRIGGKIGLGAAGALLFVDLYVEISNTYNSITKFGATFDFGMVLAIIAKVLLYVITLIGLKYGLNKHEEA